MKKIIYILLVLVGIQLASCKKTDALPFDNEGAEKMLAEKPDSLARILEEQINPDLLSDSLKADYGWWLSLAHFRLNRSLMNDTIIHFTLQYYKEHESSRLYNAYVLAGRQVNWAGNKPEEEIQYLKKGVEVAKRRCDTAQWIHVSANLSHLYFLSGDIRSSLDTGNELLCITDGNSWEKMISFYKMGCCYAKLGIKDSMLICMKEAIDVARQLKSEKEYDIIRNYTDCLNDFGLSKEAQPFMRDLYAKYPPHNFNDSMVYNFSYASHYLNLGKMDSMYVCLQRLDQLCDKAMQGVSQTPHEVALVYVTKMLQAAYDTRMGHPVQLIDAYHFSEKVAEKERLRSRIEKERVSTQSKLEQKNLLLQIKEEQGRQLILLVLLIAASSIAFLVWRYQRKLLKKERYLQQAKEQMRLHQIALRENEQLIRQNEETIHLLSLQLDEHSGLSDQLHDRQAEIARIREENNHLLGEKQKLEQEIGRFMQTVPDKSPEMETYERITEQNMVFITCVKQVSSVLISQYEELRRLQEGKVRHLSDVDWSAIYTTIDRIFNRYTQRLRQDYPLLTEEDIQCCCLIKLQLSTSAIAVLYSIAPSSVTKRKQRIKERINQVKGGLIGKEQPVDVYLWGY